MMGQRLRRWPSIKTTLAECPAHTEKYGELAGVSHSDHTLRFVPDRIG